MAHSTITRASEIEKAIAALCRVAITQRPELVNPDDIMIGVSLRFEWQLLHPDTTAHRYATTWEIKGVNA